MTSLGHIEIWRPLPRCTSGSKILNKNISRLCLNLNVRTVSSDQKIFSSLVKWFLTSSSSLFVQWLWVTPGKVDCVGPELGVEGGKMVTEPFAAARDVDVRSGVGVRSEQMVQLHVKVRRNRLHCGRLLYPKWAY